MSGGREVPASRIDLAHAGNGLHAVLSAAGGRGIEQRYSDHSCKDGFDATNEESGAKSVTECVAKSIAKSCEEQVVSEEDAAPNDAEETRELYYVVLFVEMRVDCWNKHTTAFREDSF